MADSDDKARLIKKQDIVHIAILSATALVIGVYLIATTVLISKDGVFYIGRAQQFARDPIKIIKVYAPCYPFLILLAHKFAALFADDSSLFSWIYSAQAVTLLCRMLSLIPLYFIGKLLVGGRHSFWALLILVVLPYPARFGSDVMREWPHLLFLASGFLLLLLASKYAKCWPFLIIGLISGMGYLIRIECAQLIIYGAVWLIWNFFSVNRKIGRAKLFLAMVLLVTGFAVSGGWHIVLTRELPSKTKAFINISMCPEAVESPGGIKENGKLPVYAAGSVPDKFVFGSIFQGFLKILKRANSTLMYIFLFPLIIGGWVNFRRYRRGDASGFFVKFFMLSNVVILLLLYRHYGYISKRHVLPLVTITIFYVPVGLKVLASWFGGISLRGIRGGGAAEKSERFWFCVLLIAGMLSCIPKLIRPIREDKKEYLEVSRWLRENSDEKDMLVVPDRRISFYALRDSQTEHFYLAKLPANVNYIVKINKGVPEQIPPVRKGMIACREYSRSFVKKDRHISFVVYKLVKQ